MSEIQYNTHLHAAILQQDYEWAACALQFGANPNCSDEEGNGPLHWLVMHGQDQTEIFLHLLIQRGCSLDMKNKNGQTPVEMAQHQDNWELALKMSTHCIDVDKHDVNKNQPAPRPDS